MNEGERLNENGRKGTANMRDTKKSRKGRQLLERSKMSLKIKVEKGDNVNERSWHGGVNENC